MKSFSLRHAILSLLVCAMGIFPARAHIAAEEMAAAAIKLLTSLDAEQKGKATFEFKNAERENWHFIPKARKGLPLGEMKPEQRTLTHALLRTALSTHGYHKTTNIMSLETILRELEGPNSRMTRDPELYYVSVFGQPAAKGTWGWRFEGHHLSLNFTIVAGELITGTPSFLGSNPGHVKDGPRKGLRVLGPEEDLGRNLVKSLNSKQRKQAVVLEKAPRDIITAAERTVKPLEPVGILHSALNDRQKDMLMQLISEYLYRYRSEMADQDLEKITKAGLGKIGFAWAGGLNVGEEHYYRVQGPTFLLEYDNTQNNANHVHAVWRDFANDFGDDILRKHYEQVPHP